MKNLNIFLIFIALFSFSFNKKAWSKDIPLYTISEFNEDHPKSLCGKSINLDNEFGFEIKFINNYQNLLSLVTLDVGKINKSIIEMINSDPKGEPHYTQEYHLKYQLPIDQKFTFRVKNRGSTTLNFKYKFFDKSDIETSQVCKIDVNVSKATTVKEGL